MGDARRPSSRHTLLLAVGAGAIAGLLGGRPYGWAATMCFVRAAGAALRLPE
jgi:hypothetical protein